MTPKVGDVVERDGLRFTVTHVMPRLTPYKRANQDTRVEGWTLGLRRCFVQVDGLIEPWGGSLGIELL